MDSQMVIESDKIAYEEYIKTRFNAEENNVAAIASTVEAQDVVNKIFDLFNGDIVTITMISINARHPSITRRELAKKMTATGLVKWNSRHCVSRQINLIKDHAPIIKSIMNYRPQMNRK